MGGYGEKGYLFGGWTEVPNANAFRFNGASRSLLVISLCLWLGALSIANGHRVFRQCNGIIGTRVREARNAEWNKREG